MSQTNKLKNKKSLKKKKAKIVNSLFWRNPNNKKTKKY